jgi:hypothetical protein
VRHSDFIALIVGCICLSGLVIGAMRFAKDGPLRWWDYAGAAVLAAIFIYGLTLTPMPI